MKPQGVTEVSRFRKTKDGKTSPLLILRFAFGNLPSHVAICQERFQVQTFYQNPIRCFKCQIYGHTSKDCKREQVCSNCGTKGHSFDDCGNNAFCIHCKGNHATTSRSCPEYSIQKQIIRTKVDRGINFKEASDIVRKQKQDPSKATYATVVNKSNQANVTEMQTEISVCKII